MHTTSVSWVWFRNPSRETWEGCCPFRKHLLCLSTLRLHPQVLCDTSPFCVWQVLTLSIRLSLISWPSDIRISSADFMGTCHQLKLLGSLLSPCGVNVYFYVLETTDILIVLLRCSFHVLQISPLMCLLELLIVFSSSLYLKSCYRLWSKHRDTALHKPTFSRYL